MNLPKFNGWKPIEAGDAIIVGDTWVNVDPKKSMVGNDYAIPEKGSGVTGCIGFKIACNNDCSTSRGWWVYRKSAGYVKPLPDKPLHRQVLPLP